MRYLVISACADVRTGHEFEPGDEFPAPTPEQVERLVKAGCLRAVEGDAVPDGTGSDPAQVETLRFAVQNLTHDLANARGEVGELTSALDAANRNVAELTVERDALKRQVADMKAAAAAAGSAALDNADQGGADGADDKGAAIGAATTKPAKAKG